MLFWILHFMIGAPSVQKVQHLHDILTVYFFTLILLQDCECAAWVPPSSPPSSPTSTRPTSTSTPWTTTARPQTMSRAGMKSSKRALLKKLSSDFHCEPPLARSSWRVVHWETDSVLEECRITLRWKCIAVIEQCRDECDSIPNIPPLRGKKLVYVNNLLICYVYLWQYLFFCVGCSKSKIAQHASKELKQLDPFTWLNQLIDHWATFKERKKD